MSESDSKLPDGEHYSRLRQRQRESLLIESEAEAVADFDPPPATKSIVKAIVEFLKGCRPSRRTRIMGHVREPGAKVIVDRLADEHSSIYFPASGATWDEIERHLRKRFPGLARSAAEVGVVVAVERGHVFTDPLMSCSNLEAWFSASRISRHRLIFRRRRKAPNRPTMPTANEPADDCSQQSAAASEMPARCRKAGEQFKWAERLLKETTNSEPTDREVYDYVQERLDDQEKKDFPYLDTWCRNLRGWRNLTGNQKNKPRTGRTGRSVLAQSQL